ncbi:tape measure protein [Agrobacterium pusense]|uniref:tape measure protein n=1 Tax=Agrobacterium pusense TaxID=648995 RepID=UPI00289AB27F|nr:tape measure protein [Agrobacterium pusense]
MATDLERLVVQLSADIKGYQNALNRAQGITNRQARAIESRFAKMNSNINSSFRGLLTGSVAGIGAALGTREIAQYADAWTEAGNKINAAATSAGVQARSLSQLKDGANEARTAFGDYVDLYARLIRSASGVAKNEQEIADATNIVSKAFKAGGASAAEAAGGILQLGQALASGVLNGDELSSIRTNAPILAQAIATEFKVSIGELKQLGAEGKLTSDRVFKAILNAQKPIEAQFAATNATIGDAFTRLKNQMMEYVGGSDSAFGASAKLNEAIGLLSNNIGAVADAAIIMAGAFLVNYAGTAANAAVAATYKMVSAHTAQRVASVESARTALASAQAIQASAAANLQYAQTALVAARNGTALGLSVQQASRAMVVAQTGMAAANARVIAAQSATTAAIAATGIAATTTAGAMRLLNGALALVGGPGGAALLAAYAIYQLYDAQSDAERAAKAHGEAVNELKFQIDNLDYANSAAVASTRTKIASDVEAAKAALERAKAEQALAASIVRDEVNPAMRNYPSPDATDVENTVSQNPVVKERQQLIDQLDKQLKDLEGINAQFESYASGKAKPTRDTTGFGAGVGAAASSGKSSGSSSTRADEYAREVEQITKRTAALKAETAAQAGLNPLLNDYGYTLEFARAKQDLLTAAQEAGITITPELTASIEQLASGYANAVVESERLAESQDKARQAAEDFKNTAKDITSGFISDLRSGTSAAEALSNALNKVLDKIIDIGLNSIFGLGGGGGLFSFLGFKDGGKIPAFAGGGKLSGPGTGKSDSMLVRASTGEYIVNAKATKEHLALLEAINGGKLPAFATGGLLGGGIAPKAPSLPSVSNLPAGRSSKDTVSIVLQDDSGRMASIADQRIETASGTIVNVAVAQSSRAAPAAMAQYQNSKGGAGWR